MTILPNNKFEMEIGDLIPNSEHHTIFFIIFWQFKNSSENSERTFIPFQCCCKCCWCCWCCWHSWCCCDGAADSLTLIPVSQLSSDWTWSDGQSQWTHRGLERWSRAGAPPAWQPLHHPPHGRQITQGQPINFAYPSSPNQWNINCRKQIENLYYEWKNWQLNRVDKH